MKDSDSQTQLIQEFSQLSSWEDKYRHIIELGKTLAPYPEEFRNEDFRVKGCQSQVWLYARSTPEHNVEYFADSDALITKGIIALLLRVYSGLPPQEILSLKPDFIKEIGLMNHLTPSRASGLGAMLKQIHFYALALQSRGR